MEGDTGVVSWVGGGDSLPVAPRTVVPTTRAIRDLCWHRSQAGSWWQGLLHPPVDEELEGAVPLPPPFLWGHKD